MKDRLLNRCLHLISNGIRFFSVISLSFSTAPILIPVHKNSSPYHYKNVYKMERIIYQKAPIPPPFFLARLYRSDLATTSLYLFLLCADVPFYRSLHICGRGSKSLTRCVEEFQRPVFYTQGSSCGLIYPFALCSIQ